MGNQGQSRAIKGNQGQSRAWAIYCIPLYFMISRDYQNNCTNDGKHPYLFLSQTLHTRHLSLILNSRKLRRLFQHSRDQGRRQNASDGGARASEGVYGGLDASEGGLYPHSRPLAPPPP